MHLTTGIVPRIHQTQQAPYYLQGESQAPTLVNEIQALGIVVIVYSSAALAARGLGQDSLSLIEANRFYVYPGSAGKPTDRYRFQMFRLICVSLY